jgi:hypothetical protein
LPQRPKDRSLMRLAAIACGTIAVAAIALGTMGQYGGAPAWWEAGSNERMPFSAVFKDTTGDLLIYNAAGDVTSGQHPFFRPLGTNGRGCITCHQLSNGMSVTPEKLQERWLQTTGHDAVFAAVDGSNCPDLPQSERTSHSLLLDRGLFRIEQQWPAEGVTPEFTIEVMRDPTGCNSSKVYGLHAEHPSISVYRRPRMVANLRYLEAADAFTADSRATTLQAQAQDAFRKHMQGHGTMDQADTEAILDFERQIYVSQGRDDNAGDISSFGAPALLGSWNLGRNRALPAGNGMTLTGWSGNGTSSEAEFKRSVERGSAIFSSRPFTISKTANLKDGNATQGTCTTCHSERRTGAATTQAWMDIGTASLPWAGDQKDLPLFKITCSAKATPHPYLGRVIYTNDPGRALITGKCADVGSLVMQQLRALPARAPYFTGGSAKNLQAVVEFYNRRYQAHYTPQEEQDLVNFLSVL